MSDILVFPEQFSFDVRVTHNNPRRRLTIKNVGTLAVKINIVPPAVDSFTVTDIKGHLINSKTAVNLISNGTYCIFIQKNSKIGIVPEDVLLIETKQKNFKVVLKPAVSLVSLEELEAATDALPSSRSTNSEKPTHSSSSRSDNVDYHEKPKSAQEKPKSAQEKHQIQTKGTNSTKSQSRLPVFSQEHKEKKGSSQIEFSTEDFRIPTQTKENNNQTDSQPKINKNFSEDNGKNIEKNGNDEDINSLESNEIPAPISVISPVKKDEKLSRKSQTRWEHDDILEQSLHVKFSFKDDDFSGPKVGSKSIPWYNKNHFEEVSEPPFSFELMMTGDDDDPIFCIDGDYYDMSGRLLTIQQGKSQVIFVTEQGQTHL